MAGGAESKGAGPSASETAAGECDRVDVDREVFEQDQDWILESLIIAP